MDVDDHEHATLVLLHLSGALTTMLRTMKQHNVSMQKVDAWLLDLEQTLRIPRKSSTEA